MISHGSCEMEEAPHVIKVVRIRGVRSWVWLVIPLGMVALLWLWHVQWACPWLTVRNEAGVIVFSNPLSAGQEFGIRFVHSVALSPVEEWFVAEDGLLALQRTVYQDFGAGLPHEAAKGQRMTFAQGQIVLSGFTLKLAQMDVRVGRVAEHQLLLTGAAGRERVGAEAKEQTCVFPLTAWAPPGSALRFAVEVPPLWERLRAYFR